ncbi:MAG: DUF2723 domain-containing protein [Chloroflexi bacterium]|nr:DUF2723 domain-containing protein [Chloroflexota bacterium]
MDIEHARRFGARLFRFSPFVLLAILALLYLLTLDTGLRPEELRGGDLITHQYAQVQGRPSNAPGYPLYTMGGWLWFRLGRLIFGPHANPIPILSSYSTLWALVALWLLYQVILEVTCSSVILSAAQRSEESQASIKSETLRFARSAQGDISHEGGDWPIALLVTAFYGVTYFFWYYAVTTEQYTSAVAWTLAVLLLAFRWERTRRDGYLLAIAFLAGVGLAHMLTLLIIIPPLLWFVLRTESKLLRRPKLIVFAIGLAALPLLSYVYVYVRGAQHPEWRGVGQWASAWQWFWSFVSTQQGRAELTWSLTPFFTREFPSLIWGELTVPGLVAGLLGLATLGRRRAVVLYVTLAIYLVFCWIDRLGNWFQVIMPAYALAAVGIAAGVEYADCGLQIADCRLQIANRKSQIAVRNTHYAIRVALLLALIALTIYRGALSYPRANSHDRPEDTGLTPGWAILADEPAPGMGVVGTLDETLALNYLTEIRGERPDVRSVTSVQARTLLAQDEPLAVTEAALPLVAAEISRDAHFSALGRTVVAVSAAPNHISLAGLQPWAHDFGLDLRLTGGQATHNAATRETVVLLLWEARAKPAEDWSVSVRLTQGGKEIAQLDRQHPVSGAYPTSRWLPGEVVGDAYPFALPLDAAPDGVTIILYRQTSEGGFVNLDVARFQIN